MIPAIESFLRFRPTDQWIRKNSGLAWLDLAIDVPYKKISIEAQAVFERSVEHRDGDNVLGYSNHGWRSLCLHGIASDATSMDNGVMQITDVGELCPDTMAFVKEYWHLTGAGRIRFMWLMPGGYIMPHVDRHSAELFECNIAIHHPTDCAVQFIDRGRVPFESGKAFIIDTSFRHFAFNRSAHPRLHLIIHADLQPGIVRRSYEKSFYT